MVIFFFSSPFLIVCILWSEGDMCALIQELRPGWMEQWGEERDIVWEDRYNNVHFVIVL